MLVLPPPSRYSNTNLYNGGLTNGTQMPAMETMSRLEHHTGVEYQLIVGEGTYVLRDSVHLATPPPHPSEPPVTNPNPLSTILQPPTVGTKLSILSLAPRKRRPTLYKVNSGSRALSATFRNQSLQEDPREARLSGDSEGVRESSEGFTGQSRGRTSNDLGEDGTTPAFGEGNSSLAAPTGKDALKRRKPKNNIIKSNSSFVSRVVLHDGIVKRLQERQPEDVFAFANVNRAFHWLDLSSTNKHEFLSKILFTKAHALCHDVNDHTKSSSHLDIIMGFSSGDIIWYEPITQKYARLNKNGAINAFPVSEIRWIPGSENLFLAAHTDGSLIVYDKDKEDAAFIPEENDAPPSSGTEPLDNTSSLHVSKSVNSRNQKFNPVACWKLSNQRINAFAFSPDCKHLAVVSEDGSLRIIDYLTEQLLDLYTSYYGGFICVCWSPDGKYVLTGGQDDLVSIWSLAERQIVARCQGHQSWVTSVAFDPWRCDERNYRFGSVGDDCRLLLWDFSVGMLARPKAASVRHRGSITSHFGGPAPALIRRESQITNRFRSNSNVTSGTAEDKSVVKHPVESWARTATLPPVMDKKIDPDPLCWLEFEEDCIMTSCTDGHIRTWDRPKEGSDDSQATLSASGSR